MPDTNDSVKAFHRWLWDINSNRRYMYHKGFLARDRWENWKMEASGLNVPIDNLAKAVWDAYEAGFVNLTQSRVDDDTFAYWATKRKLQ